MDYNKPIEIAPGFFWIGVYDEEAGFHCNPYLLVDGDEAVLFDPGTRPHFRAIVRKILEVVNPLRITRIVLHHQDPDLCAAVPDLEPLCSPDLTLVSAWRAGVLISYYGVRSPFYYVDRNNYRLTLRSGRLLTFIPTPFCHCPGSIVTYDEKTELLLSSDLFGAFSYDWSLYAGEYYMEAMKAFHEPYMPSPEILRRAVQRIERRRISTIAPQHGSILRGAQVGEALQVLKNLDCGDEFIPLQES